MRTVTTKKGTELPIRDFKGKDYLDVQYRVLWFREERPEWSIETEYLYRDEKLAIAKATIKDEVGRIRATAHKYEDKQGFQDYLEKCETSAIGRALALVGYGTQFAVDMDEGERIVDSPSQSDRGVYPEQPPFGEGIQDRDVGYRVDFGKWNKRSLEEVYRNEGSQAMANYITYLESEAKKQDKPITGKVAEFIKQTEQFLGAMENKQ